MVGIDLSQNMLDIAQEKKIYQELIKIDIEEYLKSKENSSFNIVTSTDVFIYIGKLSNIFELVNRVVKRSGIFAFSTELLLDDKIEYKLNKTGRFSHSKNYINTLAQKFNFIVVEQFDTILREEKGQNVYGVIYILKVRK